MVIDESKLDGFIYNQLWMIDSIPDDERQTGKLLFDDCWDNYRSNKLSIVRRHCLNKRAFLSALADVLTAARHGSYPLIHIECHGDVDGNGVVLANNDFIHWRELESIFKSINAACRLNLAIIFSCCHGIESKWIGAYSGFSRAPFYCIFSPKCEITHVEILYSFSGFYNILLSTNDISAALTGANKYLSRKKNNFIQNIAIEHFFEVSWNLFLESENNLSGKERRALKEQQLSDVMELGQYNGEMVNFARKIITKQRKNIDLLKTKMMYQYFYCDRFPENVRRFMPDVQD